MGFAAGKARAEHDVGAVLQYRIDELRILVGVIFHVGVLDDHEIAGRRSDPGSNGSTFALD